MSRPMTPVFLAGLLLGCGDTAPTNPSAVVASVRVVPDTARVAPGGQVMFTATPLDPDGAALPDRNIVWTTSAKAIADVTGDGVVTGIAAGSADILASVDGKVGKGVVVVSAGTALTVSDAFERPDGPLGPSWLDQNDNLAIQSGEVGLRSLGGSSLARWVANAFGPDQFSGVVIGTLDGKSFSEFRGLQVFVRMQLQGTPWRYGCHYFSNSLVYQIKYDGGPAAETRILDESSQEPLPQPGDRIRLEAVGDTIRCFVNDQLKLQAIDDALAAGAIGFVIGLNPAATEIPRRVVGSWSGGER